MTRLRNTFLALATSVCLVFAAASAFADDACDGVPSLVEQQAAAKEKGAGFLTYSLEDSAKIVAELNRRFPKLASLEIDQMAVLIQEDDPTMIVVGGFKKGCTVKVGGMPTSMWKDIENAALKGESKAEPKS